MPMGGRSLAIYEECFKGKKLNNTQAHNNFLKELGTVLYSKNTRFLCQGVLYHGTTTGKHKKKNVVVSRKIE